MIKFVDIATGKLFNGEQPYEFEFENGQSTNLIYTKQICFVTDSETSVAKVTIPSNPVFSLLDLNLADKQYDDDFKPVPEPGDESILDEDFVCYNIKDIKTNQLTIDGEHIDGTMYYIYNFYIAASCPTANQVSEEFEIQTHKGTKHYVVSADFYDEDETLLINLANQGIEIPESIQRALLGTNVHEEEIDSITLNNKWKELLLNSWDTFVCRGSYKSLINTLDWFGYGDALRMKEYWKRTDDKLFEKELTPLLSSSYKDMLNNYSKSTYIGIQYALEQLDKDFFGKTRLDLDKNPELESVVSRWSNTDMALKLSLLGNFYKTYFMPIHTDLIKCTLESTVFTNNIQLCAGAAVDRVDEIDNIYSFNCSIGSAQNTPVPCGFDRLPEIVITNQNTQTGISTLFGHRYDGEENYENMYIIGVDEVYNEAMLYDGERNTDAVVNTRLKTFWSQLFGGPAAVATIQCTIKFPKDAAESIIEEQVAMMNDTRGQEKPILYIAHDIIDPDWIPEEQDPDDPGNFTPAHWSDTKKIVFRLLYTTPGVKTVDILFRTTGGRVFSRAVKFNVVDNGIPQLKIYKIVHNSSIMFGDSAITDGKFPMSYPFITTRTSDCADPTAYRHYIPYDPNGFNSINLNRVLMINGDHTGESRDALLNKLYQTYLISKYNDDDVNTSDNEDNECDFSDDITDAYTLCISRSFGVAADSSIVRMYGNDIFKNELGFFPEFHHLEEICNKYKVRSISDFEIEHQTAICIIPVFYDGVNPSRPILYTKDNASCKWTFKNESTGEEIVMPSFQSPILANNRAERLKPGYYTIKFQYQLSDGEVHEIVRDSAFRIIPDKKK